MMQIKYEYQGHKCPFKAKVWDIDPQDVATRTVIAIVDGVMYPFKGVDMNATGGAMGWKHCEPITEPKVIPWTAKTAPFPLALRKKKWNEGEYMLFDVGLEGPFSCSTNSHGGYYYSMTFRDLAEPDSEWETRDGKPCGEVVE